MKTLVRSLSAAVRRFPWVVIVVVVGISLVLGSFSQQFVPEEDSNESFAPDAPELDAIERIPDLFGEESSVSVMQVVLRASGGNVFTVDGLAAVEEVENTVRTGAFADILVEDEQQPAILSFITPVQFALADGAPPPATDEELRALFEEALGQLPPEQAGFATQLLPSDANIDLPQADSGLLIIFTTGAPSVDEFDQFVDQSAEAADEISATQLPGGFTAEPFSFELLFADQDEFQAEIGRLFGTAALIIVIVLALVFLVAPRRPGRRTLMVGGFAAVIAGVIVVILPTLATVLDSVFPDAIADWNSNALFGIVALLLLAVLLIWSFTSVALRRTAADTVLTLVTIFFAISWMNGLGFLIYGEANPMVNILPILLIGLGVDYSIHLTSRYREEMAGGAAVDDAIERAIRTVGVALVLATVTTAVGFLTNVVNEIPALREFGLLAAVGIVASFLLMLTLVPAVREILDRRGAARGTLETDRLRAGDSRALGRTIGRASVIATKASVPAVVVALVLGVAGFVGFTNLDPKFSFLDFVPTTSPLRDTFSTLLDDYGGGFGENTQILIEGDVDSADAWNGMVEANRNLTDTANVVTFAGNPSGISPVAAIGQLSAPESPTFSPEVQQALQATGVDSETFLVPAGTDLTGLYDAAFAAAPEAMVGVLHRDGTGYDAALFDITTQAGEAGANQLRDDVLDDFAPVSTAGATVVATSDEIINDVVVTTLRDSQTSSLWITLLAALALLVVNFAVEARRPMLGVITTLPVFLVVMWSFGLMVVFGIPFGPVTATISALAIGIGIPYMIHITHRYLEDRTRSRDAEAAVTETLTHTGGALAGSAVTTIAGFGILVTSTTIPFRQFGFVTAYTILLALIAGTLVLPSMLILWDRWHRRRGDDPIDVDALAAALETREPEGVPGA